MFSCVSWVRCVDTSSRRKNNGEIKEDEEEGRRKGGISGGAGRPQ